MFLTRSEYDRGVNTFSPEGRLFQVEYAIEAVKLGSTSIAICTSEGVIIAAEKRVTSKLMVQEAIEKVSKIDKHIAASFSGLIADSRTLVEKAQAECQNYWFVYNRQMRVEDVTQSVANLALQFGDDDAKAAMSRPFGVAMLFAGVDEEGPQLFHLDPSGTYIQCIAKAIGAASDGAEQSLKEELLVEDQPRENVSLEEAEKIALKILRQVMEEKLTSQNVEIVTVTPITLESGRKGGRFYRLNNQELEALVSAL